MEIPDPMTGTTKQVPETPVSTVMSLDALARDAGFRDEVDPAIIAEARKRTDDAARFRGTRDVLSGISEVVSLADLARDAMGSSVSGSDFPSAQQPSGPSVSMPAGCTVDASLEALQAASSKF